MLVWAPISFASGLGWTINERIPIDHGDENDSAHCGLDSEHFRLSRITFAQLLWFITINTKKISWRTKKISWRIVDSCWLFQRIMIKSSHRSRTEDQVLTDQGQMALSNTFDLSCLICYPKLIKKRCLQDNFPSRHIKLCLLF